MVDNSCKFAAGGYIGSAEDYSKVWLAALNGDLFGETGMELLKEEIFLNNGGRTYNGFGFGVNNDISKNGVRFISANGDGVGGRAGYFVFPDQKIVVTVVANASGEKLRKYVRDVAVLFLEEVPAVFRKS